MITTENINTRIYKIRKEKKLTQKDFGERIGMKANSISDIEKGKNSVTEYVIKLVCSEFSVNENWLRTGAGGDENMFIPEDMKYFQNVGKLGNEKNEFKKFYLNMMMGLPDEFWEYVYKEFKKFEEKKGK
ncbi:helix-turn-helix transcriptional regulator [Hungatella hathewayi]|uniref:helix-turn-helix domain-containing protein n=1 Tax=Hungatella hathewayi TaxID=154046 RepID=UPI0032BF9D83